MRRRIAEEEPEIMDMCKHAAATEPETLAKTAFADPWARRFPIHTPEHALLSHAYARRQPDVEDVVRNKIAYALEAYGVTVPAAPVVKQAAQEDRYLLPQTKALPVSNPAEVSRASEALLSKRRQLKMATLIEASVNAVKIANEYSMAVDALPPDIYKYAGLATCDAGLLLDHIDARYAACQDDATAQTYDKVAKHIERNFPANGMIQRRDELTKIAAALHQADEHAGLTHLYGKKLADPMLSVFNLHKFAEEMATLADTEVPLRALLALDDAVIDEFVGDGASASKSDPATFKSMIETLPADVQRVMLSNLRPYLK